MTTYLVRFSTNGIDQTEYTLTTNDHMSRRDLTDVACAVTGVAIQPETITIYQQVYPA
jgi:hypothetical protein